MSGWSNKVIALAAASLLGTCGLLASPASAATPPVTVKLSKSQITLGQAVTVTGHASSDHKRPVDLEQMAGGRWSIIKKPAVSAKGSFSVSVYPGAAGIVDYRVLRPAARHVSRALSGTVSLAVFRYHYLSDLTPVQGNPVKGPSEINGTNYPHSVRYQDYCYYTACDETNTVAVYNLQRGCTTLSGVVGIDDTSTTGAQDNIELTLDSGSPVFSQTFGIGQDAPIRLSTTGQLRLTLSEETIVGEPTDIASFGNMQVYCTF